jgi:Arc/MetJ-type ribon-helix-helix transcriptional regulator
VVANEDRPVSEVIRRAVEKFLEMKPDQTRRRPEPPTFRGGKILVSAENLKDLIYNDESL